MKFGFTTLLALAFLSGGAQNVTIESLSPGYYVVVAAYLTGQEHFAKTYSEQLNQQGRHTKFGFDEGRKLYYVYLEDYSGFDESIQSMLKARKEGFENAWVRIMKGEVAASVKPAVESKPAPTVSAPAPAAKQTSTARTETKKPIERTEAPATAPVAVPSAPVPSTQTPVVQTPAPASPATAPAEAPVSNADIFVHPKLLTGSPVMLTLYNPTNNIAIDGEIEIVDAERAKLLVKAKGNELMTLPDPKSKSGKLTLISNSFGFRKVQHELNYKSTEKDTLPSFIDFIDNHYRIKFDMNRLHRGDIAVLYNVYFYNDAAIMLPESQYELNKLLQMMKDNPTLTITLHGHTNGNSPGKIISMANSTDFFTLNSNAKQGFGSAKELSRARAQIIKDWLVSNQVPAERMTVEAHGGKRMIHDKNSANAKRNVRVEVEVTHE